MVRPAPPEKKTECKFFGQKSNPARIPLTPIPVRLLKRFDIPSWSVDGSNDGQGAAFPVVYIAPSGLPRLAHPEKLQQSFAAMPWRHAAVREESDAVSKRRAAKCHDSRRAFPPAVPSPKLPARLRCNSPKCRCTARRLRCPHTSSLAGKHPPAH